MMIAAITIENDSRLLELVDEVVDVLMSDVELPTARAEPPKTFAQLGRRPAGDVDHMPAQLGRPARQSCGR